MKTYVWALPTRIFHWLLVIGFATAYLLGESDYRNLHYAFGALVGSLIVFRLFYAIVGPKYSNFRDFPVGVKKQVEFLKTYFSKTKTYVGHNPAASVVMILILLAGLTSSITGYLLYSTGNESFEGIHEVMANVFLVLVGLHLLGIAGDTFFHGKIGTLKSMFTGYKSVEAPNVRLTGFHKVLVLLWFTVPFLLFYLAYGLQTKPIDQETRTETQEQFEQDD